MRRFLHVPRRATGTLFALLLIGTACSSGDEEGGGAASGDGATAEVDGTVTIAISGDPVSLDPAKIGTGVDALVASPAYETLVRRDVDGQIVAGLAREWDVDLQSARFTLRDEVVCSDGTPLTATMVADSLDRLVQPETASRLSSLSFGGAIVTTSANDAAGTVTIELDKPWADLLVGLSMPWTGVICPAGLADPDGLASTSAGTGGYVLQSAQAGQRYTFQRRDGHERAPELGEVGDGSIPATIVFRVVANESTAVNLLESGEIHAGLLTGPEIERVQGSDRFTVDEMAAGSTFVLFNEAEGHPGADPSFREAVMQAIDREAYHTIVNHGVGEIQTSIVQSSIDCYDPGTADMVPEHDPAAANAGLEDFDDPVKVVGTTQLANGAGTEYLQTALTEIGLDVVLENSDTTSWATTLFSGGDWDITVFAVQNIAETMSAVALQLVGASPPDGTNVASISNPAWSAAVEAATTTAAGCDAWADGQRALLDSADVLPLSTLALAVVWGQGVSGLAPQGLIDPSTLRLQ